MKTFKVSAVLLSIAAVLAIIVYLSPTVPVVSSKEYKNEALGLSFTYPAKYVIEERLADGERAEHHLTLITEADLATPTSDGEGPTAITFSFYQNNLDNLSVTNWVHNTSLSNFKLSGQEMPSMNIDGVQSFTYSWDGLYRGVSAVVPHGDWMLMATATYLTPQDQIITDFQNIVKSIKLATPAPISSAEPDGKMCAQVITPAKNLTTGEVKDFPTPCDVPAGWQVLPPQPL